jgi:hypothetical protein
MQRGGDDFHGTGSELVVEKEARLGGQPFVFTNGSGALI